MAIRAISLNDMSRFIRTDKLYSWMGKYEIDLDILKPYKDDTFIAIFAPGQHVSWKQFEDQADKYTILFKNEKKAVNAVHHGVGRNTVVVFELKD